MLKSVMNLKVIYLDEDDKSHTLTREFKNLIKITDTSQHPHQGYIRAIKAYEDGTVSNLPYCISKYNVVSMELTSGFINVPDRG